MLKNEVDQWIFGDLLLTEHDDKIEMVIEKLKPFLSSIEFDLSEEACKENTTPPYQINQDNLDNFRKEITKAMQLIDLGYTNKNKVQLVAGVVYLSMQIKIFIIKIGYKSQYLELAVATAELIKNQKTPKEWMEKIKIILK